MVKSLAVWFCDSRNGVTKLVTGLAAPVIAVGVKVDRGKKLGLERNRGVGASKELNDENEAIFEAANVAEQVPDGVTSALFYYEVVR